MGIRKLHEELAKIEFTVRILTRRHLHLDRDIHTWPDYPSSSWCFPARQGANRSLPEYREPSAKIRPTRGIGLMMTGWRQEATIACRCSRRWAAAGAICQSDSPATLLDYSPTNYPLPFSPRTAHPCFHRRHCWCPDWDTPIDRARPVHR